MKGSQRTMQQTLEASCACIATRVAQTTHRENAGHLVTPVLQLVHAVLHCLPDSTSAAGTTATALACVRIGFKLHAKQSLKITELLSALESMNKCTHTHDQLDEATAHAHSFGQLRSDRVSTSAHETLKLIEIQVVQSCHLPLLAHACAASLTHLLHTTHAAAACCDVSAWNNPDLKADDCMVVHTADSLLQLLLVKAMITLPVIQAHAQLLLAAVVCAALLIESRNLRNIAKSMHLLARRCNCSVDCLASATYAVLDDTLFDNAKTD